MYNETYTHYLFKANYVRFDFPRMRWIHDVVFDHIYYIVQYQTTEAKTLFTNVYHLSQITIQQTFVRFS